MRGAGGAVLDATRAGMDQREAGGSKFSSEQNGAKGEGRERNGERYEGVGLGVRREDGW